MSEQTKLSVEEAAKAHRIQNFGEDSILQMWDKEAYAIFLAGHTHATNDANLVPLDKVVGIIEEFRHYHYIENYSTLITQIKNLTKE